MKRKRELNSSERNTILKRNAIQNNNSFTKQNFTLQNLYPKLEPSLRLSSQSTNSGLKSSIFQLNHSIQKEIYNPSTLINNIGLNKLDQDSNHKSFEYGVQENTFHNRDQEIPSKFISDLGRYNKSSNEFEIKTQASTSTSLLHPQGKISLSSLEDIRNNSKIIFSDTISNINSISYSDTKGSLSDIIKNSNYSQNEIIKNFNTNGNHNNNNNSISVDIVDQNQNAEEKYTNIYNQNYYSSTPLNESISIIKNSNYYQPNSNNFENYENRFNNNNLIFQNVLHDYNFSSTNPLHYIDQFEELEDINVEEMDISNLSEDEYIDYEEAVANAENYVNSDDETKLSEENNSTKENISNEFFFDEIDGNYLDSVVESVMHIRGIKELYPWQKELINLQSFRNRGNIVYSVPTSGGKSLPAEILMLHVVQNRKQSALLILPYVSLVNEKYEDFMDYEFGDLDIDLYYSSRGIIPPLEGPRIMISTIEKAVPLLNSLIESDRMQELGLIVIDEFHLIGENRGIHLESMLSKVIYLKKKKLHKLSPQVIGMSATFPNLNAVSDWILGEAFESNYRPVPLKEQVVEVINKQAIVYEVNNGEKNEIRKLNSIDALFELILETLENDMSALVFCPSRQSTESICSQITNVLKKKKEELIFINNEKENLNFLNHDSTLDTIGKRFSNDPLSLGLCFHHAGLKKEEREVIETCFKDKLIKILFCTSTLAAGVNLPAARTIICSSKIGRETLGKSQYKQMCGRAGRAGYDTFGESFLILKSNEIVSGWNMIRQEIPNLKSSFNLDAIRKLVMESCTNLIEVPSDILLLASSTLLSFLSQKCDGIDALSLFMSAIQDLKNNQFIVDSTAYDLQDSQPYDSQMTEIKDQNSKTELQKPKLFSLLKKGRAISLSSFGVIEATKVIEELELLQSQGLILSDPLHILFNMTPREPIFYMTPAMWKCFYSLMDSDQSDHRKRIMKQIGIDEIYVFTASMDHSESSKDKNKQEIHIRFYSACILLDLIHEREVINKYCLEFQASKLDQLREMSAYFGSMSLRICEIMEWNTLAAVFKVYLPRVAEGCKEELLPLLEVEGIGKKRARLLHRIGIKTPEELAQSKKSYIKSKLGSKLAPKYKNIDTFLENLISNAKKYLMRKARELRRQMEKFERSIDPNFENELDF